MLIPEWPGQTHVWMWREFVELRKQGLDLCFFSTRRPPPRDAARHSFAEEARRATTYLWPLGARSALGAAGHGLRHPWRTATALWLSLRTRDRRGRYSLHNAGLVLAALVLSRGMRALGCRHLYVHSAADSALVARFASIITGVPFSVVVNAKLGWWGGALDQKLGQASAVVAHARWIHEDIIRSVPGIKPARVVLAPVGVDLAQWPSRPPRPRLDPPIRLISVGRLHRAKGHAAMLRVVAAARREGLDIRITILGGGPMQDELTTLLSSLGLGAAVELPGSVPEHAVRAALAESDIFVLPSEFEALGVVYMEAMAIGLPVIGTRNGGVSEVVEDGKTGLLVDPADEGAILDAIKRLVRNDALRASMVRAARARVEQLFDSKVGAARVAAAIRANPSPE